MDGLQLELAKLQKDANLGQTISDVDKIIEQLEKARDTITAGKCAICHEKTESYNTFRAELRFYNAGKASKPPQEWFR